MTGIAPAVSLRRRAAAAAPRRFAFDGVKGAVVIDAGRAFIEALDRVAPTWPRVAAEGRSRAVLTVRADAAGYRIDATWLDRPFTRASVATAVCAFLVELVYASLGDTGLCLHCGAVETGGGLIVFPSTYRAGKSTLVAALAGRGVRVHADDLMPLTPDGEGVALGINPRLRRPLPAHAPERLRTFVARHPGPRDQRYQYLDLPAPLLSPCGERRPIRSIVTLNRKAAGKARLVTLPPGSAARQLILQHFGTGGDPREALDRLLAIVVPIPSFRLDYSDLDDAVLVLQRAFGSEGARGNATPLRRAAAADRALEPMPGRLPRGRLVRVGGVAIRMVDGVAFLAEPGSGGIFELNPISLAVWNLLDAPVLPKEIASVLAEAFPEVSADAIDRDVAAILRRFRGAGLIDPAAD